MVIHKPNHSICVVIVTSFNNGWTWSIKPGYKSEQVPLVGCEWLLLIRDRIRLSNSNTQQHLKKNKAKQAWNDVLGEESFLKLNANKGMKLSWNKNL